MTPEKVADEAGVGVSTLMGTWAQMPEVTRST